MISTQYHKAVAVVCYMLCHKAVAVVCNMQYHKAVELVCNMQCHKAVVGSRVRARAAWQTKFSLLRELWHPPGQACTDSASSCRFTHNTV